MKNLLIKECLVLPMEGKCGEGCKGYFRGSIGVEGKRIAFVSSDPAVAEDFEKKHGENLRVIEGKGKLAMPGLVNIHGHVSMTLMRGYADDIALMDWLNDYVWPFESKLVGDDIKLGAEIGIAEMLLGGTTTFVDMYWNEIDVAEAVKALGIRAVLSPTFTDTKFEDFKKDFKLVWESYGNGEESRISLMIAPHSVYSCSRENLLYAKELAEKHNLPITIHLSETDDEQRTMRERVDMTPAEYLDELGMLKPSTLVVHCVHLNESDIELIAARGCSAAYNPHSNMKISSGVAPIVDMVEAGINVGIATDGASSNNDLDMWEELRTASFLQKSATGNPLVLPAYEVLKMATLNGAKALGKEGEIGSLKEGKLADIILIDVEKPHLYPQHDMVANLVYCGKSSDVDSVIVDGEIVVEGGELKTGNSVEICHRVQKRIEEIERR